MRRRRGDSRGVHGRHEVERHVAAARPLEADERLHVLQVVHLVLQPLARVRVDRQDQRSLRREFAAMDRRLVGSVFVTCCFCFVVEAVSLRGQSREHYFRQDESSLFFAKCSSV